jgi:hypothetical protein
MNHAVLGDPIFGIGQTVGESKKYGQTVGESKKYVPTIPNIWVTVKGEEIDQHIAFQKKP